MLAKMPPTAGPTDHPRLIASRFNEYDRVRFPGSLYQAIAAAFAGRKDSPSELKMNMHMPSCHNVRICPSTMNITPFKIRLAN